MKTILDYATGLHRNVPHDVYHQRHIGLVSKSALDKLHRSAAHYKAWVDGAEDEPSEALAFGGAFHCMLLEPDRFAAEYAVEPDFGDCRYKENKATRDAWRKENAGKASLDASAESAMRAMVRSIHAHPLASRMIRDGEPELTVRWKDADTGLECKTRTDYYVRPRRMAVDVKTAEDASEPAFRRSVANFRYHVTDALYRAGFGAVGEPIEYYVFVVVEKRPPHAVAVYTLDSDAIQRGYAHATSGIQRLAECVRNDDWPGYPVTIQTLELPPWAA